MNVHGVEMVEQDDMVVHSIVTSGSPFEPESVAAWREAVRPNTLAVDVGAYTGLYAIMAAQLHAKAIAFEPNYDAYSRMWENITLNGVMVTTWHAACGAAATRASIRRSAPLSSATTLVRGTDVSVYPLDELLWTDVSAIKIDTEGYEIHVLNGAHRVLCEYHPLVIAEANTDAHAAELITYMERFDYQATPADGRNLIFR